MNKLDVIQHFGGVGATARALGITQPSVSEWGDVVPPARQLQIERVTGGALKASPDALERLWGKGTTTVPPTTEPEREAA